MYADLAVLIKEWLLYFSEQPELVYTLVVLFMFASSFGLPVPEEVVIVSLGTMSNLAYQKHNSFDFAHLNPLYAAVVCSFAVLLSDFIVFSIGRYLRPKIEKISYCRQFFRRRSTDRVQQWMQKYGYWSAGLFRFTPGMRLPGHLACGMFGVKPSQFLIVDGFAALISVPSQILLIGFYGDEILKLLAQYKLPSLLLVVLVVILLYRLKKAEKARPRNTMTSTETGHQG